MIFNEFNLIARVEAGPTSLRPLPMRRFLFAIGLLILASSATAQNQSFAFKPDDSGGFAH